MSVMPVMPVMSTFNYHGIQYLYISTTTQNDLLFVV